MERLRAVGTWWLPEREIRKIPGILEFDLERAGKLTLIGELQSIEDVATPTAHADGVTEIAITDDVLDRLGNYGRIQGLADGKSFTLEGAFRRSSRGGIFGSGAHEETVHVNRVYEGIAFDADETAEAHKIRFAMDGLTEWMAASGLSISIHQGATNGGIWAELRGAILSQETAGLPGDGKATFLQHLRTTTTKPTLTEAFGIEIRYEKKKSIVDLLDVASDAQDLVSIATGRTAQFTDMTAFHPDVTNADQARTKDGHPFEVWSPWTALRGGDKKPLSAHDMFFSLDDIDRMTGFSSWMYVAEKYRSPLGRAMATKYAKQMYVSDRLLNCAAALEGFDRIMTGRGEGPSFLSRLQNCIQLAGHQFEKLVPHTGKWARELRDHRNEIAHHFGRRMREQNEKQFFLAESAYWLLILCLLREAGVNDDLFDKLVADRRLRFLEKRIRALL